MSGWPKSEAELKRAGYVLTKKSLCRGNRCASLIHWYKTPAKKLMPLSQVVGEPGFVLEPHFVSCVNAADFRKGS